MNRREVFDATSVIQFKKYLASFLGKMHGKTDTFTIENSHRNVFSFMDIKRKIL